MYLTAQGVWTVGKEFIPQKSRVYKFTVPTTNKELPGVDILQPLGSSAGLAAAYTAGIPL